MIDVKRVRKFPAPDDPNTVWLPAPPNAIRILKTYTGDVLVRDGDAP